MRDIVYSLRRKSANAGDARLGRGAVTVPSLSSGEKLAAYVLTSAGLLRTLVSRPLKVRSPVRQSMHTAHSLVTPTTVADRTGKILAPLWALLLLVALSSGCANETSQNSALRRDHEAISRLLDAALLSDDPRQEFQSALPKVRAFSTVDSAWIDGHTFYVVYKQGGLVSWTARLEPFVP